jgi:hypothetical protein
MLANGRPEMVARAVRSFHEQEYPEKQLVIWNTGARGDFDEYEADDVVVAWSSEPGSIGVLRNRANQLAIDLFHDEVEIFAHWDSDDWSHPRRLAEQVELLDATRADLVGYRECLFFDSTAGLARMEAGTIRAARPDEFVGEAWIYRNGNPAGPIGSSFLYPRATWERTPFPDRHAGEDTLWLLKLRGKVHGVPSTWSFRGLPDHGPRMICSIHGANTSSKIVAGAAEWKREPLFDLYCRSRMRG